MDSRDTKPAAQQRWSKRPASLVRMARARMVGQAGFTLVELLVVIIIAAIVSVAVLMAFSSLSGAFQSQEVRIQNQDDARSAVNQMARYLRMATSSVDNPTSQTNAIATALPQDIEFYCDLNGDGVAEKLRYYLDDTTLLSQSATAVWVTGTNPHWSYPAYETNGIVIQDAIRNGSDPVFSYWRYEGGAMAEFTPTTPAERQQIVTITVSVKVNEDPESAQGAVLLATDVQIRQRYEGGLE